MALGVFFVVHGLELDDVEEATVFAGAGLDKEGVAVVGDGEGKGDYNQNGA